MSTLAAAQAGDEQAFAELVAGYRRELYVHCYRMLGSLDDADEALQETMLAAWRGLGGFEQRSSLRAWLYRIATNCSLRLASKRPMRMLSWDYGPARAPMDDLGAPVTGPIWLQPWPDGLPSPGADDADPAAAYGRKESIELAYVAALQRLSPNQRAVLILREVLELPAAEVADLLDTSTQSVNSALQRARKTVAARASGRSQQEERLDPDTRGLVDAFVEAFERGDVTALVRLLAKDVRFTMPPLPAWFDGRDDVTEFFARRVFATAWRAVRLDLNGQPGFAGYQQLNGTYRLGAVNILSFRAGKISWIASFLDPSVHARLGLPAEL
ncbi:MAG TPA: RNA polymerase subunit sigma-70 [Actinomycetes bacterium]|nr:RNA polymerase subunit sigma-70 [Actinomycetes bacterium]